MVCLEFDPTKLLEIIATAIATLAAAYFGSAYAFKLNRDHAVAAKQNQEILMANKVLFKLTRQLNALINYRNHTLEEFRTFRGRHLRLPAISISKHQADRIVQDELHFLHEWNEANLLFEVLLEDDRFDCAIEQIHMRTMFHHDKVQPAIEKTGTRTTIEKIEKELGARNTVMIKSYTDQVYDSVYKSCDSLKKAIDNLHAAMKTRYPDTKFIKGFIETAPTPIKNTSHPDYRWK